MNTTAHNPYAKFSEDDIRPILGFEEGNVNSVKRMPLVPSSNGQKLVKASVVNGYNTEYEIVVDTGDDKQILHG
jgi:hypothetical protein